MRTAEATQCLLGCPWAHPLWECAKQEVFQEEMAWFSQWSFGGGWGRSVSEVTGNAPVGVGKAGAAMLLGSGLLPLSVVHCQHFHQIRTMCLLTAATDRHTSTDLSDAPAVKHTK